MQNDHQVIDGLYADPDLSFMNGKAYIYPTTDGYENWAGNEFYVFSSEDGKHFEKGPRLLHLGTDEVKWATGNAWAPCIAYRNGTYYFYFCGRRRNGEAAIGVAWASAPEGPFTAAQEPMLTLELMYEHGISISQVIDPSVFVDGEDYWIVFGNGEPVIAKLAENMCSILPESMQNLKGAYEFRESMIILKHGGQYHFTWSCDDTRSENYHVNYGVSDSLYGPITYLYPILQKCPEKNILGTGHHSIAKLEDQDSYRIAYHRFGTPLEQYKNREGYCREVCISELKFGEDGRILPIVL